jgi:hypothetical protein
MALGAGYDWHTILRTLTRPRIRATSGTFERYLSEYPTLFWVLLRFIRARWIMS